MEASAEKRASIKKHVEALQSLMKAEDVVFYVVPSEDAHQSEYIAPQDKRREFISGFSGSAGLVAVTSLPGEKHCLWTDGRYYTQAEQELDMSSWALMKTTGPSASEYIAAKLPVGASVGADPRLLSVDGARAFESAVHTAGHGRKVKWIWTNLVDKVWKDKALASSDPIIALSEQFSGQSVAQKLEFIRKEMATAGADVLVLSALDEIAWLLNIRGTGDIEYNPVVISYAIVHRHSVELFIDQHKVTQEIKDSHLQPAGVTLANYDAFFPALENLAKAGKKIMMDPASSNWAMYTTARSGSAPVVEHRSPVQLAKALKNKTELEGMRQCHIRDGAAQAEFFAWLEAEMMGGNPNLTETGVAQKQLEFRRKQQNFKGPSFGTISSVGANAAIIHYHPPDVGSAKLVRDKIYLNDSGAQYLDGTTDVTRTFHYGTPTARERDSFTRVVKGMINLSAAAFPKGTNGYVLDVLARKSLWEAGLDYNHGTGHGVGHFLNVHEWPARISCQNRLRDRALYPLDVGMVTSNEPGYYEPGAFGIRIENLMFVKEAETPNRFDGVSYLCFEQLTMCPIQTSMLDVDLMEKSEIQWLNKYHQMVWDKVSPLLQGNEQALSWLKRATSPL